MTPEGIPKEVIENKQCQESCDDVMAGGQGQMGVSVRVRGEMIMMM